MWVMRGVADRVIDVYFHVSTGALNNLNQPRTATSTGLPLLIDLGTGEESC